MISNTHDKNKFIRYLYGEMTEVECTEMEQEMTTNPALKKEMNKLLEAKESSEAAEVQPSDKVVNRILTLEKQERQPRKRPHLDTTHTH